MSVADQKQFTDAVAVARAGGHISFFGDPYGNSDNWVTTLKACNRLAMFDMLPAIQAISPVGKDDLEFVTAVEMNRNIIGAERIKFACTVVRAREIEDRGIPDEQVNDGREFLGCTRLEDAGVQNAINTALSNARAAVARGAFSSEPCCGIYAQAWTGKIGDRLDPTSLVGLRRAFNGASLNSNLAAAAHYMLARYHVCAAKASRLQMSVVIDRYDDGKRSAIAKGDRNLSSMALTPLNPPFPPDFAINRWAKKGSDDGEIDHSTCNSSQSFPVVNFNVNGKSLEGMLGSVLE